MLQYLKKWCSGHYKQDIKFLLPEVCLLQNGGYDKLLLFVFGQGYLCLYKCDDKMLWDYA